MCSYYFLMLHTVEVDQHHHSYKFMNIFCCGCVLNSVKLVYSPLDY